MQLKNNLYFCNLHSNHDNNEILFEFVEMTKCCKFSYRAHETEVGWKLNKKRYNIY